MEQIGGDHITHIIKIFIIRIRIDMYVKQNSDEKCKGLLLLLLCYSHAGPFLRIWRLGAGIEMRPIIK
jgi:hypothetical protein